MDESICCLVTKDFKRGEKRYLMFSQITKRGEGSVMKYKYAHPEFFDGVPRPDFEALSGNLIIYGAGFQGLLVAFLLKRQGINVLCFGDQNIKKQGTTYYGLPVYAPEEMKRRHPNATAIVTPYNLRPAYEYVKNELRYENAVTPFSLFLEFDSEGFDDLPELPEWYHPDSLDYTIDVFMRHCVNIQTMNQLFVIDLSVTEKCNLRCKNCTSLMPNYQDPQHFDEAGVLHDMRVIMRNRIIHHINLEGGEAFLWKPLPQVIRELCKAEELMNLILYTNGTVIPNSDLLEAMRHPKVRVRISDYGAITKKEQLSTLFEKHQIKYSVCSQKWYELSAFHKEPHAEDQLQQVLSDCCKATGSGAYLVNGKLFRCPIQGQLHCLGIYPAQEKDYVDLRDTDEIRLQKRITEFMSVKHMPPVVELCCHCDGRGYAGVEVPPAEQLAPNEKITIKFT